MIQKSRFASCQSSFSAALNVFALETWIVGIIGIVMRGAVIVECCSLRPAVGGPVRKTCFRGHARQALGLPVNLHRDRNGSVSTRAIMACEGRSSEPRAVAACADSTRKAEDGYAGAFNRTPG